MWGIPLSQTWRPNTCAQPKHLHWRPWLPSILHAEIGVHYRIPLYVGWLGSSLHWQEEGRGVKSRNWTYLAVDRNTKVKRGSKRRRENKERFSPFMFLLLCRASCQTPGRLTATSAGWGREVNVSVVKWVRLKWNLGAGGVYTGLGERVFLVGLVWHGHDN